VKQARLKTKVYPAISKGMARIKSQSKKRVKSKNKPTEETYGEYPIDEIEAILGEEDIFIPIEIEDKIIPEIVEPEFDLQLESQKGEAGEGKSMDSGRRI
jgi:hypothetical protein